MKRLMILLTLLILLISSQCFGGTYYITPTGNGDYTGSSWANALDTAGFAQAMTGATVVPDTWYFLAGNSTYTAATPFGTDLEDGSILQPIMVVGVTPMVTGPWPNNVCSGASRPFIQLGTYNIAVDNYWGFHGLMIEGTADYTINGDAYCKVSGCSIFNVSTIGGRTAISINSIYNSEISSTVGTCAYLPIYATHNYVHDSNIGVQMTTGGSAMFNVISDIVTIGLNQSSHNILLINNTLRNCGTGINSDGDASSTSLINNLLDTCTVGIAAEKQNYERVIDYNNYWNNGTDITGDRKGLNSTAYDPNFTNYVPDAESGVTSAGKAMKDPYGAGE